MEVEVADHLSLTLLEYRNSNDDSRIEMLPLDEAICFILSEIIYYIL